MSKEYRSLYAGLVDHPKFLPLSADAKLVFFMVKLQLGASGIGVLYPATVAAQIGGEWDSDRVCDSLRELSANGERAWVKTEANVVWIRKGLENEPQFTLSNSKHAKAITNHLATLPKLAIVNEFAAHYDLPIPHPDVWEPLPPPDRLSDRVCDTGEEEKGDTEVPNGTLSGSAEPNADGAAPKGEKRERDELTSRRISRVFEHWRKRSGHDRATLTKERRGKIRARLLKYSDDELCLAIDAACVDPFMLGDNDRHERYDFPETIFRTDAKTERWIEKAKNPTPRAVGRPTKPDAIVLP